MDPQAAAALRDVGDSHGEAFSLLIEVADAYVARQEANRRGFLVVPAVHGMR